MRDYFKNSSFAKTCALSLVLGATPATHAVSADQPGGPFLGLFEGNLLIPDAPNEPIAMRFDASGGMDLVSKLEPTERESRGLESGNVAVARRSSSALWNIATAATGSAPVLTRPRRLGPVR